MAADPESWQRPFAIGHPGSKVCVITGDPEIAEVAALAHEFTDHAVIVAIEREDLAHATGRPYARVILHTLPDPHELPDLEGAAPLPAETSLDHVPRPLADEIRAAARAGTVWAAWVNSEPVSFAYAPWRSPAWFDISVDTLPQARQLGLAAIVASAMIRAEREAGREPVWAADEDNHASLRLAHRLGFQPSDELWIAPPAPTPDLDDDSVA